jgi:hypothetical protein
MSTSVLTSFGLRYALAFSVRCIMAIGFSNFKLDKVMTLHHKKELASHIGSMTEEHFGFMTAPPQSNQV